MNALPKPILIHPIADYVTEAAAALATGYSVKAIQEKRYDGVWVRGQVWVKAPDGRVLISIQGYNKWAASQA